MKKKIRTFKELKQEQQLLKVKEDLIYAEINQNIEKMGFFALRNLGMSLLKFFKKS